jgi:hypothetical protein
MISFAFAMIVVALIYAIGHVSGCQIIRWTRHRRGGLRGHHPGRPATGASINPARTIGPMLVQQIAGGTVRWGQLPIYVLAELAGAVAAGSLYSVIVSSGPRTTRSHRNRLSGRIRPRKEPGREEVHQ